ncbi:MAG: hypothetical protein K8T10_14430 [Candidatus Eremiobacteraeota bacterium]|nr:hypothetical protein [Candidatus Eremiobacteraeota bacterium]
MVKYCKKYIDTYYVHFKFFKPECMDKRIREVMMRKNECSQCPGIKRCRWHPEFWMEGEEDRMKENEKLMKKYPDQGELLLLPEDIIEDSGIIQIEKDVPEIETILGI